MRADITVRQARGFVTLCRLGGFTAAAEELGISQSGLSLLVQALEKAVGQPLIVRSTRPLTLTDVGKRFLPIAERIVHDVDLVIDTAMGTPGRVTGRIVIAALPTLASSLLPRAIKQFNKLYPDTAVHVRDVLTEDILARVRSGDADIGLGAFLDRGDDLAIQFLFRDRLVAVASAKTMLNAKVNWKTIAKYPLIMMTRDSNLRQIADRVFIEQRLNPRPTYEVSYVGTAVAFVSENLGIAILPATEAIALKQRTLRVVDLIDPPAWREIGVISRKNTPLSPAINSIIEILRTMQISIK